VVRATTTTIITVSTKRLDDHQAKSARYVSNPKMCIWALKEDAGRKEKGRRGKKNNKSKRGEAHSPPVGKKEERFW